MSHSNPSAPQLTFLAISGSLRGMSSNATLLGAAARLAGAKVRVVFGAGIGDLPHFNPDLDGEGTEPPPAVALFRAQIREADAILISSPEYIHGVPGSLKNALDWTASTGDFMGKPVALINASATSSHAQAALLETLTVLMAEVTATRIPLRSNKIEIDDVLADDSTSQSLRQVIDSLVALISSRADRA